MAAALTYRKETAVDAHGKGYLVDLDGINDDHARRQFEYKFQISMVVYDFEKLRVKNTFQLPPVQIDPQTGKEFHSFLRPPVNEIFSNNTTQDNREFEPFIWKRYTTRTITDNTMRQLFAGYNIFYTSDVDEDEDGIPDRHRINRVNNPGLVKSIYPVYNAEDPPRTIVQNGRVIQKGWDWKIAELFVTSFYKEHFVDRIVRSSITSIDPSVTWNSVTLFSNGHEGSPQRTFANEIYEGMVQAHDAPLGTCIPEIIFREFIRDGNGYLKGHKKKAEEFIRENLNKGVTLENFSNFIRSLRDVNLMIYDPLDRLVHKVEQDYRSNNGANKTIVCRLEDNHLFHIQDKSTIRACSHVKEWKTILSQLPGAMERHLTSLIDWNKAEYSTDPLNDMMKGGLRVIVYEEGTIEKSETGGMEMAHLMAQAMIKTKVKIGNISWDKHGPSSFQVPGNHNHVLRVQDYHDRHDLMKLLYGLFLDKHYEYSIRSKKDYHWANQSYMTIGILIFESLGYNFRKLYSSFRKEHYTLLTTAYQVNPMQDCLVDNNLEWADRMRTFDCVRNYTYIMYYQRDHWNIFNEYTTIIEYEEDKPPEYEDMGAGEYETKEEFHLAHPSMKIPPGWYPSDFIKVCIRRGFTETSNIKRYMRADNHLEPRYFNEFIEEVYNLPDGGGKRHKSLINFFIGGLCKFKNSKDYTFITDDEKTMQAAVNEYGTENVSVHDLDCFHEGKSVYVCRLSEEWPLYRTGHPIARQIFCKSWLCLSNMWESICTPETNLLSFKCDAITISGPIKEGFEPFTGEKIINNLGSIHEEEPHLHYKARERLPLKPERQEEINEDVWQATVKRPSWKIKYNREALEQAGGLEALDGAFITGPGGSGKTYMIAELLKKYPSNHMVLCYQNVACANIRNSTGLTDTVKTFDSFFLRTDTSQCISEGDYDARLRILSEKEVVIVDEFGQTGPQYFVMLYNAWLRSNKRMKIYIAGDVNQTAYLVDRESFRYRYPDTDLIKILCNGNYVKLDYITGVTRCDEPLQNVLKYVLENKKLPPILGEKRFRVTEEDKKKGYNICQTRTRGYNSVDGILRTIGYTNTLGAGDEVICTVNEKKIVSEVLHTGGNEDDYNVYNGNTYIITDVNDRFIDLEGVLSLAGKKIRVTKKFFQAKKSGRKIANFEQNRAQTVYKIQGQTLDPETRPIINIYAKDMTLDEVYTALSRAKTLDQIRIYMTYKEFRLPAFSDYSVRITIKNKRALHTGYIYKLVDDWIPGDKKVFYVGMTTRTIQEEFEDIVKSVQTNPHRPVCAYIDRSMRAGRFQMIRVEQVEEYYYHREGQLREIEEYHIKQHARMGHDLVNKQHAEEHIDPNNRWTPIINPTSYLEDLQLFNKYADQLTRPSNIYSLHKSPDGGMLTAEKGSERKRVRINQQTTIEEGFQRLHKRLCDEAERQGLSPPEYKKRKRGNEEEDC